MGSKSQGESAPPRRGGGIFLFGGGWCGVSLHYIRKLFIVA